MTPIILFTGQESGRELLELRRDRIKKRRIRKAALLTGAAVPAEPAGSDAGIITFPSPNYPRIA